MKIGYSIDRQQYEFYSVFIQNVRIRKSITHIIKETKIKLQSRE